MSVFGTDLADGKVAQLLGRLVDVAKEARRPFMESRKEIYDYAYAPNFNFLYQDFAQDMFFKAKIAKAAEFVEIMGAALYPVNPEAAVNSLDFASPTQRQRHQVEEKYADYSFRHGALQSHGTRCVYEALLSGRGCLWTGFNPNKQIVQSVFDSTGNLLLDPDAKIREELNWVARKRIKPRWRLSAAYPDQREAIQRLEKTSDTNSASVNGNQESASDLIEYHEFYAKQSIANYAPSLTSAKDMEGVQIPDSPMKYCFANGVMLSAEPWEIPFFHDNDGWPVEWYDPLECGDRLWPESPLKTGLGHIKCLNWLYTFYISKLRITLRTPFVLAEINGVGPELDEAVKLVTGKDFDFVKLKINGAEQGKIGDYIQQLVMQTNVEEFERAINICGTAFEKASGLYEVLYTGTTPTQIRNATTAELIRNTSQSRVELMRGRMGQFMSGVTRKTLFAARFLEQPQDMARLFGPQAGAVWGTLAPQPMVDQERQQRAMAKQQMTMQLARQAQMQQMIGQQQQHQAAIAAGQPTPLIQPIQPPNPAQFEAQAEQMIGPEQLVSMDEWINEADREILAGSMRPIDPEAQVQNLNVALNQLAPAVVSLPGGGAFVAHMSVEFAQRNKFSLEFVEAAQRFAQQATAVADAQVAQATAPPMPNQGTPNKGPQSGPSGGHNPKTG